MTEQELRQRNSAPILRVLDIKHSQCLVQLTDKSILFRHFKHVPENYIREYALRRACENL